MDQSQSKIVSKFVQKLLDTGYIKFMDILTFLGLD